MNLKLKLCGTQMTLHYSESYHSVSAYYMLHTVVCVLPHIIFITSLGSAIIPILQMTKQRHRIKWSDQVHTAASLTPEALAITYPNTVLDFMTDSSMKGKRLDWCQVLGTYSHGSNNNYELKNKKKAGSGALSIHPLSTLKAKVTVDAHFNTSLFWVSLPWAVTLLLWVLHAHISIRYDKPVTEFEKEQEKGKEKCKEHIPDIDHEWLICKSRKRQLCPRASSFSPCSFLCSGNLYASHGASWFKTRTMLILRAPCVSGLGKSFFPLGDSTFHLCIKRNHPSHQ